ncbi:hypothetical protein J6590_037439 [Homalodisca vitripennis]|nr:hypothetical protein J6590_037439 [Homalodisca vitripennis]
MYGYNTSAFVYQPPTTDQKILPSSKINFKQRKGIVIKKRMHNIIPASETDEDIYDVVRNKTRAHVQQSAEDELISWNWKVMELYC